MKKEIKSIIKTISQCFLDLETQIKFEISFKEELKDKNLNKYQKQDIEQKLNTIYSEESELMDTINELVDRFNYLIDDEDKYYINEFELTSFSKVLCEDALLKLNTAIEDIVLGVIK